MSLTAEVVALLEHHYGTPAPPRLHGPFEMIVWEIVAYLAADEQRSAAFEALRSEVGLSPRQILDADQKVLRKITRMGGGIAADERARRLREASRLAVEAFGGDLSAVLRLTPARAKRALMRFPMIGEPGAERILLFAGVLAVLALESNGVRVLVRVGVAKEGNSYPATYRALREATLEQLPADTGRLKAAHLLLRRHGLEVCTRKDPACDACAVRSLCGYFRTVRA